MPHVWAVQAMKQQPNALRRLVTSHRLKAVNCERGSLWPQHFDVRVSKVTEAL